MQGKNIPSRLKSRKQPWIGIPLKVNVIIGTVRSRATPTTSPFLIYGSKLSGITFVLRPPVQKECHEVTSVFTNEVKISYLKKHNQYKTKIQTCLD